MKLRVLLAAVTATLAFGVHAHAFEGEPVLYEAAKKEKALTWYVAHYNSETAAVEVRRIQRLVEQQREALLRSWDGYFNE